MHINSRAKAVIALVSVAAIWGLASVVIKATLDHLQPMTFLFFRFLMLLPVVLPWYLIYIKKHPLKRHDFIPLTLFGIMSTTIYLSLIFWGFERTTAIDGNLIGTLNPLFIILLGALILKERITSREKLGLGLAVIGTIIMVIQPVIQGGLFALSNTFGNFLILMATIVWAFFVLLSKKNFKHFNPIHITLHGSIVAVISFGILAYFENNMQVPSLSLITTNQAAFWGVFYMAFISFLFAYILYEFGMSKMEISEGSLFTYLQPLFATPIAVMALGETVSLPFIIGATIIFTGVVLSEWK